MWFMKYILNKNVLRKTLIVLILNAYNYGNEYTYRVDSVSINNSIYLKLPKKDSSRGFVGL